MNLENLIRLPSIEMENFRETLTMNNYYLQTLYQVQKKYIYTL